MSNVSTGALAFAAACAGGAIAAFVACGTDTFGGGGDASDEAQRPLDAAPADGAPGDASNEASSWVRCQDRPPTDGGHLCDDFDDPLEAVGSKWNTWAITKPTTLIDASTVATSPPNALFSWIGPDDGGAYANLGHKPNITGGTRMRLAFSFRIAPDAFADGGPPFDFLTLGFFGFEDAVCDAGARRRGLALMMTGNNSSLVGLARGFGATCIDAGAPDDYYTRGLGAALASLKGVWVRAVLLLQRGTTCAGAIAPGASYHVALNGVEKACFDLAIDPFAHLPNAYFGVGLAAGSIAAPGSATFDDVEFDVD